MESGKRLGWRLAETVRDGRMQLHTPTCMCMYNTMQRVEMEMEKRKQTENTLKIFLSANVSWHLAGERGNFHNKAYAGI